MFNKTKRMLPRNFFASDFIPQGQSLIILAADVLVFADPLDINKKLFNKDPE